MQALNHIISLSSNLGGLCLVNVLYQLPYWHGPKELHQLLAVRGLTAQCCTKSKRPVTWLLDESPWVEHSATHGDSSMKQSCKKMTWTMARAQWDSGHLWRRQGSSNSFLGPEPAIPVSPSLEGSRLRSGWCRGGPILGCRTGYETAKTLHRSSFGKLYRDILALIREQHTLVTELWTETVPTYYGPLG